MAVAPVVSRFVFLKKGEGCSIVAGSNWTRESKLQSSFIKGESRTAKHTHFRILHCVFV